MSEDVKLEPFQREERFIVIKRKHLSSEAEYDIRSYLGDNDIATVECVVIESDWPEYETVWQMIEARCTGKTRTAANADVDRLVEALERLCNSHRAQLYPTEFAEARAALAAFKGQIK